MKYQNFQTKRSSLFQADDTHHGLPLCPLLDLLPCLHESRSCRLPLLAEVEGQTEVGSRSLIPHHLHGTLQDQPHHHKLATKSSHLEGKSCNT